MVEVWDIMWKCRIQAHCPCCQLKSSLFLFSAPSGWEIFLSLCFIFFRLFVTPLNSNNHDLHINNHITHSHHNNHKLILLQKPRLPRRLLPRGQLNRFHRLHRLHRHTEKPPQPFLHLRRRAVLAITVRITLLSVVWIVHFIGIASSLHGRRGRRIERCGARWNCRRQCGGSGVREDVVHGVDFFFVFYFVVFREHGAAAVLVAVEFRIEGDVLDEGFGSGFETGEASHHVFCVRCPSLASIYFLLNWPVSGVDASSC